MGQDPDLQELTQFLKPTQIKTDSESVQYYGKDWTTYFDIKARAILFPKNTVEVQKIVLWARKNKLSLVPSGGRTGLSGGACATKNEVVISFELMNQILEFNEIEQTLHVEAGVITQSIQKKAFELGLFYPVDFAARGSSHIGGNLATNAGGIKVLRYGMTRDWVLGLTVVTGSGEILELNHSLVKNATGYDLRHLFIGSEGTLGFITHVTLKLTQPPPPLQVFILSVPALESVMNVFALYKKQTTLTAFEFFSDLALEKLLHQTGLPLPIQQRSPFYVLAEVEIPSEQAEQKALQIFEQAVENGWVADGVVSQGETQLQNFWKYREQISESLAPFSPYKNDLSVSVSQVPAFMKDLDTLLKQKYKDFEVVWFGHIGDGNLHLNILRPSNLSKEAFVQSCQKVDQLVFETIQKYHGSISAEHGVGLTKKPFLQFSRSKEEIEILKQIKKIFDPDLIINPGKLIDVD